MSLFTLQSTLPGSGPHVAAWQEPSSPQPNTRGPHASARQPLLLPLASLCKKPSPGSLSNTHPFQEDGQVFFIMVSIVHEIKEVAEAYGFSPLGTNYGGGKNESVYLLTLPDPK